MCLTFVFQLVSRVKYVSSTSNVYLAVDLYGTGDSMGRSHTIKEKRGGRCCIRRQSNHNHNTSTNT